ncbi:MAG: nodulation protein NfeD [Candidatus Bathyarchaeia archaeon]
MNVKAKPIAILLLLASLSAMRVPNPLAAQYGPRVLLVRLEETITPASYEAVKEAISYSSQAGAGAIVLQLNTPGGLVDSMMGIMDAIAASNTPFIGYVYPEGAKAWSAGTYILLATHLAAMAPHTVIGSAQPITSTGAPVNDTKVINALAKLAIERARMHGRNETAAELFVRRNLNLGAEEAHRQGVVEILARTLSDLLEAADGRVVRTVGGEVKLSTKGALVLEFSPSLKVKVLRIVSEPMVGYMLFTFGFMAIFFGLMAAMYPMIIAGAVLMILGLIGLGMAQVDLGAILLFSLGFVLLLVEALTPGFGLFGTSGIICVLLGSFLFLSLSPEKWAVSQEWILSFVMAILATAGVFLAFVAFVAFKVLKARRKPPIHSEGVGEIAEALDDVQAGGEGFLMWRGEVWKARFQDSTKRGDKVVIIEKEGPIFVVKRADGNRVEGAAI